MSWGVIVAVTVGFIVLVAVLWRFAPHARCEQWMPIPTGKTVILICARWVK